MNKTVIASIMLIGMDRAFSSHVEGIIRSFTTSSWEPRFLKDGDHKPDDTHVFVSCCKETQTPGNFLRVLPANAIERALELKELGVEVGPEYLNYPALTLVKQAKNSADGTYSGKVLASFNNALRGALKVPKLKKLKGTSHDAALAEEGYTPYMGTNPRRRRTERMGL